MPFLTGKNYTLSFWLGIPFIGTSLLIEKIILFLKRLKLMKPLAFLMMVLIREFTPSIAPFDKRLPSTLIKELMISVFQRFKSFPKVLSSSMCELLNS